MTLLYQIRGILLSLAVAVAELLPLALLSLSEVVVLMNEGKVAESAEQRKSIVNGHMSDPLQTESRVL